MNWIILIFWALTADPHESQNEYIKSNLLAAKIGQAVFGVPASIQLSQAIYESGGGKSYIAKNSNNHFGIKYYPSVYAGSHFTDRAGQKWRAYPNVFIGYIDHAYFIWQYYRSLCYKDFKQFANAKGYGGSQYWTKIVNFAEKQNLNKYD
jgi:flagellum-specific peptidoglycan hydrolase FlgJ